MAQRYKYKIDDKTKEVAMNQLNEDPSQVNAHIESLRRWVDSMPHIQCPTDAEFLLKFLRVSKFDHVKAQKRIDNFCTSRASERGSPYMFNLHSDDHSKIEMFLNLKFLIGLGKIDSGEKIFLFRFDGWNPDTFPFMDIARLSFMCIDIIISEEESQIFGMKFVVDMKTANLKHLEAMCDPKMLKVAYSSLQDAYPVRLKGQFFCSDSTLFDFYIHLILFFLNDKMKKRVFRLSHDISKVKDRIPGLDRILPKEYNGNGGTLDECAERWNERFRNFYKDGQPFQSIHVDESKRPKDTLNFLATHADYKSESGQKEGTFTKFENVF